MLLLAVVSVTASACASAEPGAASFPWPGDLPSAVNAVIAAGPACGLKQLDARRVEEKGGALLVFVDEWPTPKPESSHLTIRLEPSPAGTACLLEARPLAELGLTPPDIRAGSETSACTPCAEARSAIPLVRYSRGLALSNAARTTRCVRAALEAAAPGGVAPRAATAPPDP